LQWHIGYSVRVFVAKSDKDETPLEKGQCSFSEDDLCLLGWRVYWYETGQ